MNDLSNDKAARDMMREMYGQPPSQYQINISDLLQVLENLALIQGYLESAGSEIHLCKARIEATKARARLGSAIKRLGLIVEAA